VSGRRNAWILAALFLVGVVAFSGCVTVGEYERLKEDLAEAEATIDQKNQRIQELDASRRLYEEKALALEDETSRYRKHSAEADKIIEDLRAQLAEHDRNNVGSPIEGMEFFVPESGGNAGIRLSDEILFDSGSTVIKAPGKRALDWVISQLKQGSGRIEILGHTDTDPVVKTKAKYPHGNIQLSAMRAISVFEYLKSKGIAEDRMNVSGFGPYQPLAPNDTRDNKTRNRRVEIIVHADQ
jgi:chemotaxis protein MotB